MQVLNRRDIAPPETVRGGDSFRYTHAETGYTSKSIEHSSWLADIKKHREANGLEPVSQIEAEDQLCQQLPPEWCHGEDPNRPWVDLRISLADVEDGMRVFGAFAVSGFEFTSQDEADRRARICVGCYANINAEGCGACRAVAGFITGVLGGRKTQYDEALRVCGVCKCLNRAQVHIPMNALKEKDSPDKQSRYPAFCWQKVGGENYLDAA